MSSTVVLAAAMVVSSAVIYVAFSKQGNRSVPNLILRSCLCSEGNRSKRKKKRVRFAENVKENGGNWKESRRQHGQDKRKSASTRAMGVETICRNDMPANRIALYNGILRDRVHRWQESLISSSS